MIRERGYLRCGIPAQESLFAQFNETSECYSGYDIEYCQAIAVAVFGVGGDINIEFVPVSGADRFEALENDEVDVVASAATNTLSRTTKYDVLFTTTYFYDGQGFLAPKGKSWDSAYDMVTGTDRLTRPIVVQKETTSFDNAVEFLQKYQLSPSTYLVGVNDAAAAFLGGNAYNALTGDASFLVSTKLKSIYPEGLQIFVERISREPLALAVRDDDSEWFKVVNAVVNGLILAELHGITKENVGTYGNGIGEEYRLLGRQLTFDHGLPVSRFFMKDIISILGNYGEIYHRHWGDNLARAQNNLYTTPGGLLYPTPWI